ncbi:MAG: DUF1902 domain-containing protein [Acidimicrobiales bacterium]
MVIKLRVHLESTDDPESPFVWWAESDEVRGFSAAAGHLAELLARSQDALADLLGQEIEVSPTMVPNDEPVEAPSTTLRGDLTFSKADCGQETVQVSPPMKARVPA